MHQLILRISTTLDGVMAGENDEMDLFEFSDEGIWTDLFATLQTVNTILVGRGMHAGYFGYWQSALTSPTATPNEQKYAAISARTRHLVVSRTLREVKWPNASVLGGVDPIAQLKHESGGDIILYGGPTLAAAVIDADLIDEYHFVVHPLIAGHGKKLFTPVVERHELRLRDTQPLASGIIIMKYRR